MTGFGTVGALHYTFTVDRIEPPGCDCVCETLCHTPGALPLRHSSVPLSWLRVPRSLLSRPRLMAEDGSIFFADAFNRTPQQAILTPYAGYWQLAPRLIAEAGAFLPVTSVPLFYALCALLLCSLTFSWFYLPHFRPLVKHDGLRLAFMLLLVLMPASGRPSAHCLFTVADCAVGDVTGPHDAAANLWVQWLLAFLYLAALATAPVLFVLASAVDLAICQGTGPRTTRCGSA